jgi:HEAT repeat protein
MRLFGKPDIEKMKQKRDLKGLYKSLKDATLQHDAAQALREIGGEQATELLIQAMRDEKTKSLIVVQALGKIGDPRAIDPLIGALSDTDLELRKAAAKALGKIGDPVAIDPLKKTLLENSTLAELVISEALDEIGWVANTDEASVKYLLIKGKTNECLAIGKTNFEQ